MLLGVRIVTLILSMGMVLVGCSSEEEAMSSRPVVESKVEVIERVEERPRPTDPDDIISTELDDNLAKYDTSLVYEGMTEEELIEVWGEPTEMTETVPEHKARTYKYKLDKYNTHYIFTVNGVVDILQLELNPSR